MGLTLTPEAKMARRILQKHSLSVPFDLESLVEKYAKLIYKPIPIKGVDGICLNLKKPGKVPTVIVNINSYRARQKFTLAHELGHIIIPWHHGTIVEELNESDGRVNEEYRQIEREADRFASELLMPLEWVLSLYKKNTDKEYICSQLCITCGVSEIAASIRIDNVQCEVQEILMPEKWILELYDQSSDIAIVHSTILQAIGFTPRQVAERIVQVIPGKVAFCLERKGNVICCGSTKNTNAFIQFKGDAFVDKPYQFYRKYSHIKLQGISTHWWELDNTFHIPDDIRHWKAILKNIALEILPEQGEDKFMLSVNGILSGLHGNWRRKNPESGIENFIEHSIQRFNNPNFADFIKHKDFLVFIRKRCEAFFKNKYP